MEKQACENCRREAADVELLVAALRDAFPYVNRVAIDMTTDPWRRETAIPIRDRMRALIREVGS